MDHFMEKHRHHILKIVTEFTHEISNKFQIDTQDLDLLMHEFFQLNTKRICQGLVVSKNNTPCTCIAVDNEMYCRRHLYLNHEQSLHKRPRCAGIMKYGKRCVHHAVTDSLYCKKHLYQQSDQQDSFPCVHYTLDEVGNELFQCEHDAVFDEWCCTKHRGNQRLYAHQFKAKSAKAYLEQIERNEREPNALLTKRIKQL
jgi:hypothetical protein